MSTRSLVRFATREEGVSFSEHPERVEVQVYKHYDGYPSGHPVDLAKFLNNFKIVMEYLLEIIVKWLMD